MRAQLIAGQRFGVLLLSLAFRRQSPHKPKRRKWRPVLPRTCRWPTPSGWRSSTISYCARSVSTRICRRLTKSPRR